MLMHVLINIFFSLSAFLRLETQIKKNEKRNENRAFAGKKKKNLFVMNIGINNNEALRKKKQQTDKLSEHCVRWYNGKQDNSSPVSSRAPSPSHHKKKAGKKIRMKNASRSGERESV